MTKNRPFVPSVQSAMNPFQRLRDVFLTSFGRADLGQSLATP